MSLLSGRSFVCRLCENFLKSSHCEKVFAFFEISALLAQCGFDDSSY